MLIYPDPEKIQAVQEMATPFEKRGITKIYRDGKNHGGLDSETLSIYKAYA